MSAGLMQLPLMIASVVGVIPKTPSLCQKQVLAVGSFALTGLRGHCFKHNPAVLVLAPLSPLP